MLWLRTATETDETSGTASCRRSDSVLTSGGPRTRVDCPLAAHGHQVRDTVDGSNPQLSEATAVAGHQMPRRD
jgi:hypothetical protein